MSDRNNQMSPTSLALFGTSADPPTEGHQAILEWLSYHYDLVAVWASDNPFKTQQTPLKHRSTMLRLLVSSLAATSNNLEYRAELSSPRSLDTVRRAREIWGDRAQLTLVIGSDLVAQLPKWHAISELLSLVRLLIVPRPGYAIEPEHFSQLEALEATWAIADLDAPEVSSSAFRERCDLDAVAPAVQDYILREKLYACQYTIPQQ